MYPGYFGHFESFAFFSKMGAQTLHQSSQTGYFYITFSNKNYVLSLFRLFPGDKGDHSDVWMVKITIKTNETDMDCCGILQHYQIKQSCRQHNTTLSEECIVQHTNLDKSTNHNKRTAYTINQANKFTFWFQVHIGLYIRRSMNQSSIVYCQDVQNRYQLSWRKYN